MKFTALV